MKVSKSGIDKSVNGVETPSSRRSDKSKKSRQSGLEGLGDSSKINVSNRAQMMNKALEIAKNTEVNNDAKIARLQKMIDEGKYKVDAESIADRMVDEHFMMSES